MPGKVDDAVKQMCDREIQSTPCENGILALHILQTFDNDLLAVPFPILCCGISQICFILVRKGIVQTRCVRKPAILSHTRSATLIQTYSGFMTRSAGIGL